MDFGCEACYGIAEAIRTLVNPSPTQLQEKHNGINKNRRIVPMYSIPIVIEDGATRQVGGTFPVAISDSSDFTFLSCAPTQDGSVSFRGYHAPYQWGAWTSLAVMLIVTIGSITAMNLFQWRPEEKIEDGGS